MTGPDRLVAALVDRYRIERELGQGGMATVYLAYDIKHDRRVALKVLKPELAAVIGADRFVVEIKTTAALQHPHILPLYDSGTVDGFLFYVMPFIDGETLRAKLDRETQLGIEDSVKIVCDVADALDYAHKHGVVHRDIKPENILLANGRPMVADFGIALALSAAAGGRMTETGLSLGTPHYMSPEQATAEKEIGARSDIYSLASVLYEMLAGQPPHLGGSAQQIIMKIITEEPQPVTALRKSVPPNVSAAIAKALEKLPADRFTDARAFADALMNAGYTIAGVPRRRGGARGGAWKVPFLVAAVLLLLLAGYAATTSVGRDAAESDIPSMHLRLHLQPGDRIAGGPEDDLRNSDRPSRTAFAFSPDGRFLVYSGARNGMKQLFLRPLDSELATPIAGTEGAESPFLSPNGEWLGFWADGRLRRVSVAGGPATDLLTVGRIAGASWSADGRIAIGVLDLGIVIISDNNTAAPDTITDGRPTMPQFLPDGRAILMAVERADYSRIQIELLELKTGKRTVLIDDGEDPRYVATGHIVFARNGTMLAVPFDANARELTGGSVVVLDDVMHSRNGINTFVRTGAMQVAVSPIGQLAWVRGGVTPDRVSSISSLDRQGRSTPISSVGEGALFEARLSPDETQLAVFAFGVPPRLIVVDLARETRQTLSTGENPWFIWSLDGKRLVHSGAVRDTAGLVWTLADGSRPPEPIAGTHRISGSPAFWSPDGAELYTTSDRKLRAFDIAKGTTRAITELPAEIIWPMLSPDGRWLAYGAMEPGSTRSDIFVQPWPALDRKVKVSNGRGTAPAWTRGGRELVYLEEMATDSPRGIRRVMAVDIGPGPALAVGAPHELFTGVFGTASPLRSWDVSSDGSRFITVVGRTVPSPPGDIHVVTNWFPELLRLTGREGKRR
jgi:eukaryotic-like serine/threonine-protein kinase